MRARAVGLIKRNAVRASRRLNGFDVRKIYLVFTESGRDYRATADRFRISVNCLRAVVRRVEGEKRAA